MTSFQKTRTYFQALAMMAASTIPAHAATVAVFDIGSGQVTGAGSYDTVSGSLSAANLLQIRHIMGLGIGGSGLVTSSGGLTGLDFSYSGAGTGGFATGLPLLISYDFDVTPSNGGVVSWSLNMLATADTTQEALFSGSTANLAAGQDAEISGSGSIPVLTGSFHSYSAELEISWTAAAGDTLAVNIPSATSLDFNPPTIPSPEPSAILLGLPGLAWLLRRARARRV